MLESWENRLRKRLYPTDHEAQEEDPCKNLIAAVVERALLDLNKLASDVSAVQQESAFDWLFIAENTNLFSLAWCCEQLGWCSPRDVRLAAERENQTVVWALMREWGAQQAAVPLPQDPMEHA